MWSSRWAAIRFKGQSKLLRSRLGLFVRWLQSSLKKVAFILPATTSQGRPQLEPLTSEKATHYPRTVARYVEAFNTQDLETLGALFLPQAVLVAPVDVQVRGREAIVDYIAQKGQGMRIEPLDIELVEDTICLSGRIHAPAFHLRARWHFRLIDEQIARLHLRLLASLQELLPLKDQA